MTLLTVTLYLMQQKRPYWYTAAPMIFMLITTLTAMLIKIRDFWNDETYLLLTMGGVILVLSIWLAVEAGIRIFRKEDAASLAGSHK
mgnify:FL=1